MTSKSDSNTTGKLFVALSANLTRVSALDTALEASGRRSAVFPALLSGSDGEEAYVARMVHRDRELNLGY